MGIGEYLIFAALGMGATFSLSYHFIVKPRLYEIKEKFCSAELEPDTEFVTSKLYRVEGHQVLVIPAKCELTLSRVKIRRVSEALVIYPRDRAWSEYAALLPADSDNQSEQPDDKIMRKKNSGISAL